jgi:hypothetical protein
MSDHRQRARLPHVPQRRAHTEIAARLGITFTNIKRHITRSRSHVRLPRRPVSSTLTVPVAPTTRTGTHLHSFRMPSRRASAVGSGLGRSLGAAG